MDEEKVMRELTIDEVEQVGGAGITAREAGAVLAGFATTVFASAIIGGLGAGPAGFLAGAITGAGRAAFSYGMGALVGGAYALSC